MSTDYYDLLEVDRHAEPDELKRAYRRLAREHHPDRNAGDPDAEAKFKAISEAYAVLSDPQARARYDQFGHEGLRGGPGGGFDFDLSSIFESFFGGDPIGGARRASGPRRGQDQEAALKLTFAESVFGAEKVVDLRTAVACDECDGSGAAPGTSRVRCDACGGAGQVRQVRNSILGQMVTAAPCTRCRETGEVVSTPCQVCRGEGRRTQKVSHTVVVPAGVADESVLRVSQKGHAGANGAPPGDLYLALRVTPHPDFERDGDHLVGELDVSMYQAALGAELTVDTLDGTQVVTVNAGTQPNELLTLRGLGVPRRGGRSRGDLVLIVRVRVPKKLTADEQEALAGIAQASGDAVSEQRKRRKR